MPRTAKEILAHADELARRFAEHEPVPGQIMDARALRDIAAAVERLAGAERDIASAVAIARAEGHSWAAIGAMLGTSGEAARQRYGAKPRRTVQEAVRQARARRVSSIRSPVAERGMVKKSRGARTPKESSRKD